ncbi:MAG: M3 family oligoendopeptidase, partial [Desulfobulbaceae bacterium]|nr:M3 family oligoendopeptidase [Desulfobulbaceae bacterium]
DPSVSTDMEKCEQGATSLNERFSDKVATLNAEELSVLVSSLEMLETRLGQLATFAYLNFATQTKSSEAGAFLQSIRELGSRIGKLTVFFELEWSKADEAIAQPLLDDPALADYRHYLSSMRRYAKHMLSAVEESLLIEKSPTGRSSWTTLFDKVMGNLQFGEKKRSEEEVLSDLYNPDREIRKQAATELTAGLKSQLHILTHIFNTLAADKMIDDRIRDYDSWVSSMNLGNELDGATVDTLVDAVTSRYDIPQRYYRIKKQMLGLPELVDYDRYAPLPHLPTNSVPWADCKDMVLKAFGDFSPKMAEIASLFFDERWIDAPLVDGKRGGAFAHPCVPDVHPYVMVNYTGNVRDVSTVAHELGHGVHQFFAAALGYYNSHTTLVLAETASVFAELLLFNYQLEQISDAEEKKAFICQKLESIFATVFRQVSMNRFEDLAHNGRREEGELSDEQLSKYWMETQEKMFGDTVKMTDDYAIWWSYIPHFLSTPGYVYSYAFGELLVLSLYGLYKKEGESFVPKYIDLLMAGGANTPYELVKPFGVDLNDPEFWQAGLDIIDDMLKMVE